MFPTVINKLFCKLIPYIADVPAHVNVYVVAGIAAVVGIPTLMCIAAGANIPTVAIAPVVECPFSC
jgi:hypothetical protein